MEILHKRHEKYLQKRDKVTSKILIKNLAAMLALSLILLTACSTNNAEKTIPNNPSKEKPVTEQVQASDQAGTQETNISEELPAFPSNPFEPLSEEIPETQEKEETGLKRIVIRMFRFGFDPEYIEVNKGDHVYLTVTSTDVGHGFALPDFGINERVPPEDSITVDFIADTKGEFEYFESVYSGKGWKDMKGTFVVR